MVSRTFFTKNVRNFDIIGISFYPYFSNFDSLQSLGSLISQLKTTYNKEIMIFETGAPWTNTAFADGYGNFMGNNGKFNYPFTPQGQRDFLFDLANTVYNAGGTGILYWEPAWISSGMCDLWGKDLHMKTQVFLISKMAIDHCQPLIFLIFVVLFL
ncbi:glycosyl hydrolase 53 family protein [Flavobacterium myungsuense]|uniref:glycosyl hydrolase 53 family protein n=1 Tax=Flavobacterium myungsuense TaxID=651823 RepID=UPI003641C63B